jgi:tRNA-binding EMAP/Myf-like protein
LKKGVSDAINALLEPVRTRFTTDPELKKLTECAYPDEVKAKSKKGGAAPAAIAAAPQDISRLDIRVGRIIKIDRHPDAESLYVEHIDLGEGPEKPYRVVVSGLVKYYPIEQLQNRLVTVLCNLKPSKYVTF